MEIEVVAGMAGASGSGSGSSGCDMSVATCSRSSGGDKAGSYGSGGSGSGSGGDIEMGRPRKDGEAYLVWQDLTVMLPNFGQGPIKKLLNGLNGYAEPGRIMAIMGPSGSGKSTLLDSLAGLF